MQTGDHLGAFANGDSFHRSGTNVADRVNPASISLQRVAARAEIRAGQHEPLVIQLDPEPRKPIRIRLRAE